LVGEFLIEDHEWAALDYAGARVVGPHDYMVVRPWHEGEGPSTVHIDVGADSPDAAARRATELYREMRRVAQLPPDAARVITVARVAGVTPVADKFTIEAEDMLEQRRYGLAVVAAQVHCEMHTREAITAAAARRGGTLSALSPEMVRSWALMDSLGPRIFEALIGVRVSSAECWSDYKAHVARRNAVVHRGTAISEREAQESIDATIRMVRFVEEALRKSASA
jgi:hypothetical protein